MAPDISYKLAEILKARQLTISTAESCTGGLIAHIITMVSGSSGYYSGSVVSYTNEVKMNVLGVNAESIRQNTEVSGVVAKEMADGVRNIMRTDIGVSTTGIAGPTGATPTQPVGTIWIATTMSDKNIVRCYHFDQDREGNIELAAETALQQVIELLTQR